MLLGLFFTFLLATAVLTVIILALALFTVEQQTAAVIERWRKGSRPWMLLRWTSTVGRATAARVRAHFDGAGRG